MVLTFAEQDVEPSSDFFTVGAKLASLYLGMKRTTYSARLDIVQLSFKYIMIMMGRVNMWV